MNRSGRLQIPVPAVLIVMSILVTPVAGAGKKGRSTELQNWWKGPVRYILGKEEIDTFKELENDADRQAFIDRFWQLRDPTPGTGANEFRDRFLQRVESANYLFRSESAVPGWRTDRGKIYILMGPPDEIRETPIIGLPSRVITWTYQATDSVYVARNAEIVFQEDERGEFRMIAELGSSFTESDLASTATLQDLQKILSPPVSLYTQAEPLSSLPPQHFLVHPDFYKAKDGNTFVAVTVGMQGAALAERFGNSEPERPRVAIFGRIVAADGPFYLLQGERGFVPSDENTDLPPEAFFLYQAGLTLPPGPYTVYFGIQDWTTGNLFTFKTGLQVPDFHPGGFSISSVTLARRLERADPGSTPDRKIPFVLGNLRVVPRPDELFRNGDDFAFYYQIYNASRSAPADAVDVDATYQFYRRPAGLTDAPFEAVGDPLVFRNLREEVQGYTFLLKDWPEADYRLRVTVRDNLSGNQVREEATFGIR